MKHFSPISPHTPVIKEHEVLTKNSVSRAGDLKQHLSGPPLSKTNTSNVVVIDNDIKVRSDAHYLPRARAIVTNIEYLTSDIKLVSLMVQQGVVSFQAGQFIGMYDDRDDADSQATFPGTYSIASRPSELPYIRFAIGADNNPRNLRHILYHHAKIGDAFRLDCNGSGTVAVTPRMVMTPVGGPGGLMLIGGGSAVMGLVSIVEELMHSEEGSKIPAIKLFHSNRSNKDIPFYDRMCEVDAKNENFDYFPYITGGLEDGETARGNLGRITVRHLAKEIAGVRLFCVCGSGVFCEAIVNMLLSLGVWPGSIRTDYTTRVDPARRLDKLENGSADAGNGVHESRRFESCIDATQEKGIMDSSASNEYLRTYGIDKLLDEITKKMSSEKPEYPLEFLSKAIKDAQARLPEVNNVNAGDPEFWINYWETDNVTWQAPVVSPWLEKYMDSFCGDKQRSVFVPLCGKTLDMMSLLKHGHRVVGADCSGIACVDFFTENNIPDYVCEVVPHPMGKRIVRHKSTSVPLTLYEGDLFDLTPEIVGPIDRILDRAALVALAPYMIEDQYLPLLTRLMKPGGKMLFASVSELPFPKAPPHAYAKEQIEGILSKFFYKMRMLEVHRYRVNAGYVAEPIYMLKSNRR